MKSKIQFVNEKIKESFNKLEKEDNKLYKFIFYC